MIMDGADTNVFFNTIGQKESFDLLTKLSWKGQINCNNLHPMALVHPDSISTNVILDPSQFICAINVHDLSVGGQFNI